MRYKLFFIVVFSSFFITCRSTLSKPIPTRVKNEQCIKNDESALRFADSIFRIKYGNKVENSKPYIISFKNDSIWIIKGTLHTLKGGVPYIEINGKNCKIIKLTHGK